MMRGSLAAWICPNKLEEGLACTGLFAREPVLSVAKFVWLKVLNNSPRNWIAILSVTGNFLKIPISQFQKPGPINWPLPTFPYVPTAGTEKAARFSHSLQGVVVPQLPDA